MLGYLLIKQLYDKSSQRYDDIDLFDALFTRHVDDKLEFHEYMKIGFFAINLYFAIIWWKNDFEPVWAVFLMQSLIKIIYNWN